MPSFDFCYLNADGSLSCMLTACCADEAHAKAVARAMGVSDYKRFEVWRDDVLVHIGTEQRNDAHPPADAAKRPPLTSAAHASQ